MSTLEHQLMIIAAQRSAHWAIILCLAVGSAALKLLVLA